MNPVISVCIITYNHERFIARAIESVLKQKVNVPIELCIGEDASSDATREICLSFAEKHPEQINLFLRERSTVKYIDGKPTGVFNFLETLKACKGQYIALLEGDDYWIEDNKLQTQLDFLLNHPNASGCGHLAKVYHKNTESFGDTIPFALSTPKALNIVDVLAGGSVFPTASLMFKAEVLFPLPHWYDKEPSDWKLEVALMKKGDLFLLPMVASVYCMHDAGVYSSESSLNQLKYRERQALDILIVVNDNLEHKKAIRRYLANTYALYFPRIVDKHRKTAVALAIKHLLYSDLPVLIRIKHFVKSLLVVITGKK